MPDYNPLHDETYSHLVLSLNSQHSTSRKYPTNRIRSTKYTILTFLPKNMFEQFRRIANFYFLAIVVLELIPGILPGGFTPVTSILPLVFVLSVTAVKEAIEDVWRARSDRKENEAEVKRLCKDGNIEVVRSQDVIVGDILQVDHEEKFVADLLLLTTTSSDGSCFVETSNLDGETNLKPRVADKTTVGLHDPKTLATTPMQLKCKPPSIALNDFEGQLRVGTNTSPIAVGAEQLLLRGARLKITATVFALVVFTGADTKLVRNQAPPPSKLSRIERFLNRTLIMLFLLQLILCLLSAILSVVWELHHGQQAWYLEIRTTMGQAIVGGIEIFFTFIALYNYMIPISLYVSVELAKLVGARLVEWDITMYDEASDSPACANTSNLLEELGQIDYVFSDKTGTLTENKMRLDHVSIAGKVYDARDPSARPARQEPPTAAAMAAEESDEDIERLIDDYIRKPAVRDFLVAMTLCHEVLVVDGEFQATIPDDDALVKGTARLGVKLLERSAHSMKINVLGDDMTVEIVHVFRFSSHRRRMSIVLRMEDGSLVMFTKGADSTMHKLVNRSKLVDTTMKHVDGFATEGLRTLVYAKRELSKADYEEWYQKFQAAEQATKDRQKKVHTAWAALEHDLELLGATAIEDCLQAQVPETIAALIDANIKVWVLTGDKTDTAINIATRCRLLQSSMKQLICSMPPHPQDKQAECRQALDDAVKAITEGDDNAQFALIIDGEMLGEALKHEKVRILQITEQCRSVLCCRVSPKQKAMVVDLVKNTPEKPVTLAIGDGANDVAMIQSADVGVGITGREGMQAARCADYAVGQFRFLKRLLFVHGRYNYIRIASLVQYSFYKNIAFSLPLFFFGLYSGFSAQTVYDSWLMMVFNIVYTSVPILVVAIIDKDVPDFLLERKPVLYARCQQNYDFNMLTFGAWLASALWHSVVIFFGSYLVMGDVLTEAGRTLGLYGLGTIMLSVCIIIVTVKVVMITRLWTRLSHIAYWGSVLMYFVFLFPFSVMMSYFPTLYGIIYMIGGLPSFWFSMAILTAIAVLPEIIISSIKSQYFPESWDEANILLQRRKQVQSARVDLRKAQDTQPIMAASRVTNYGSTVSGTPL
eukprot:TRINITY_DN827_c0_g1_i1.p1 TRINITY_DN827_c0_g1~~TRINITY_DN827_c0_g1_i1.p1  ORF type:complete len:1107 (-),score=195.10 TRINITY_DN827_c0_g1_i1:3170-6490(-)